MSDPGPKDWFYQEDVVSLTIEAESRRVRTLRCDCCGQDRQVVNGLLHSDLEPLAAYFASCYPHERETWIDVILGTWEEGRNDDHVTFGCRIGSIEGYAEPMCSLVSAASVFPDEPIFGQKLDRDQALTHPWLATFWQIIDFLVLSDPTVDHHLHCAPDEKS
jgi:hypothetical protein